MSTTTSTKSTKATDTKAVASKRASAGKDQLESLVSAVKAGFQTIGSQDSKFAEAQSVYDAIKESRNNARVITARAIAALGKLPEAQYRGKPAANTIATLTGIPRTTLLPLFKGAVALTDAKWERREAVPTAKERELVASFYGEEVTRKVENNAKNGKDSNGKSTDDKGKGKDTKTVKKITATLEGVVEASDILDKTVAAFTKDQGLTTDQFTALQTKINGILSALEAVTK